MFSDAPFSSVAFSDLFSTESGGFGFIFRKARTRVEVVIPDSGTIINDAAPVRIIRSKVTAEKRLIHN